MARTNAIFLATMIPIGIMASALTQKDKDYGNFLPILEFGPEPVLMGALNITGLYCAFLVLGMVFPHVHNQAKLRRSSMISMLILTIMFLGPVSGPIALFGAERSAGMSFPTFQMLRDIQIAEFQRLDLLGIFLWSLGSFSKIALYLFAVSYGIAKLCRMEDYKILVAPLGALLVIFSLLISDNFVDIYRFLQNVFPYYSTLIGLVLPAILLLVGRIRLRKGRKERVVDETSRSSA